MSNNKKAMVMAYFAADSLALGAHWIYDTEQIARTLGRVESLLKPAPGSYHPTKNAGDFTHYADQTFVLLKSLALKKEFDLQNFSGQWRKMFEKYDGYIDGASRKTLENYARGKGAENAGSHIPDFGGAARIAPLIYLYENDMDTLVTSARIQTAMTHNDPLTLDAAEFFARTASLVLKGESPVEAMKQTVSLDIFDMSPVSMWVSDGIKAKDEECIPLITRFGQACGTSQVFPGVVYLIAKYENNLKEALIQSVTAGGESAARAGMVGMILGAYLGMKSLPEEWLEKMNRKAEIMEILDNISR